MPRIEYVSRNFSSSSMAIIDKANEIIAAYQAQGLNLTLRQLYYRFVASASIANKQSEYKRLGAIINDGRMAGLIDWEAIEDRGRNLNRISSWDDPGDIVRMAAESYAIDLWQDQDFRVEVWVEKQALEAVIEDAASSLAVPSFACKGYTSQSEMWRAAQRFLRYREQGYTPVIIHLGDHDPSGIDMTRDIRDRLRTFGVPMEVNRIALNMDQVDDYNPPPNPAKLGDSRAAGYISQFGDESWELDALEPAVLRDLIRDTIRTYRDQVAYDDRVRQQEQERMELKTAAVAWPRVVNFLSRNEDDEDDDA